MRILLTAAAALFITAPALATKPTPDTLAGGPTETAQEAQARLFVEANTYRYAQPYRSERGTSAEACAHMCSSDNVCAAWTLTPASFQTGPRCELKRTPGRTSYRPGAVSGLSAKLLMDPARDAVMRYEVAVPEGYQPAAVPLDQLEPSPTPRVFGEPLELSEPELLGETPPQITAVMSAKAPPPPPAPPVVEAAPAPVEASRPSPKPTHLTNMAAAPLAEETPAPPAAPVTFAAPAHPPAPTPVEEPVLRVNAVKKPPAPPKAAFTQAPDASVSWVNAVVKPDVVAEPAPAPAPAPTPKPVAEPKPVADPVEPQEQGAPIAFRTPTDLRSTNEAGS